MLKISPTKGVILAVKSLDELNDFIAENPSISHSKKYFEEIIRTAALSIWALDMAEKALEIDAETIDIEEYLNDNKKND